MALVCNFTQILGNNAVTIGDNNQTWQASFDTTGRVSGSPGFIILNVAHLTHSLADVPVKINGSQIGVIHTYRPGGSDINTTDVDQVEKWRQANHWYTQMIAIAGSQINNGSNTIQIQAVTLPEAGSTNQWDNFVIKDVFCFFHVTDSTGSGPA